MEESLDAESARVIVGKLQEAGVLKPVCSDRDCQLCYLRIILGDGYPEEVPSGR